MEKPSPYQIMAFAQAARERSFSKAAKQLGVSQSSVTQHVSNLERIIGGSLLIRRRNGLELTRAGHELFEIADRLADTNSAFQERVTNYTGLKTGHLTITATAPRPALPVIARYNARYPNVRIDFTLMNWTQNMEALSSKSVDLAFVTDPLISEGMRALKIETVRYCALMPRDHPLARRKTVSLRQLVEHVIVVPEDGSLTQRVFFKAVADLGIDVPRLMKITTFAMMKEAVLHGFGVGILLENSVHDTDRLTTVRLKEMDAAFDNYLIAPAEKHSLRLIASFFDIC
ncbi:MAG: LysR family transcriptional regulator [Pseudomonadota bacterium]